MKLYYAPGACSLAPHIILRETETAFTAARVNLADGTTADGSDFRVINPRGQVPLLELDDRQRLTEGAVIARYVADRAEARALIPAPLSLARYQVEAWQNYVSTELHKGFTPLFQGGLGDEASEILRGRLRDKYQWLNGELAQRQYLAGDDFTVADAYLFTVTRWAPVVGLDLSDLTHLAACMQRIGARPAVRAALAAEG